MKSPMKNLTIQKKIIIWFSLTLLLIVFLMNTMTFAIANIVLDEDIRERLMNTVASNVEEIEYFNRLDAGMEREQGDQFLKYNNGWLEIDDDFCDFFEGICTALYDEDGNLLYGESPVKISRSKDLAYTSVDSTTYHGEKYYVYDRKLAGENLEGLWLRGVVSKNERINILYNTVRLSFWLLPVLALLTILGGYAITRRSFLPVEQIAQSAREIGESGDLSRRLDIGPGNDELHQLAEAFNNMFERLEKSFESERQFTSDASHELRTPTSVILAQAEYGLELADSEEEYRESLEVIKRQADLMNDMINRLLFFTRLEQGTEPVNMQDTDLSTLVEDICDKQRMLQCKDISLATDIQPGIHVETDCSLFTRMLNNLCSNAYKYGKPHGNITVSLKQSQDLAILSVADDGIGIARENLEKIWNRFYQVEPSRNQETDGGGIGLGLSMVKQIADLLGGEITVESILGKGTVFTFALKTKNKNL